MDALKKLGAYPVQTIQNHYPIKMDVLPKTFVQIILPAKTAMTFALSSVFILLLCCVTTITVFTAHMNSVH